MAEYNFRKIEEYWQQFWEENQTFATYEGSGKPPYYILDMFPYPSGAGLHVGHPLGYIASDIIARFKRHRGYEVLHPMGYDAFGLPAEQYAIDTGNHPAQFTDANIMRYRSQLKMIGLSYDWSREVKTSDPNYYKWTQWIFTEFFKSWYNKLSDKAESIDILIAHFELHGNAGIDAACHATHDFSAEDWKSYTSEEKQRILLNYRLAYIAESEVNWCPALGTVLANEEVKDGLSERGGYPVERRKMRQWFMRITAYADRLLESLNEIDWPEAVKEIQRNWIGRSLGAEVLFPVAGHDQNIRIFTTRPDTIFGATFMVLAPEHPAVERIATEEQWQEVEEYVEKAKQKTDRERMAETKRVTGVFTGAFAVNPFTRQQIPIWVADYVLGDYGTGAIMAVPGHDSRDWLFAKTFGLDIIEVVEGGNVQEASYDAKSGALVNSGFLNGLDVPDAIERAVKEIEESGIGRKKVNYRLRDANFSRQRYWGEPFPVIYHEDIPLVLPKEDLPVILPDVESYKPTGTGESPLASATEWVNTPHGRRETNTMPGWAGSSWYYLRYMDPHNDKEFVSTQREAFWQNVDFYLGGAEHATGHLLYSRFWHKFLYDRGFVFTPEPFKKLINQGMILGVSQLLKIFSTTDKQGEQVAYAVSEDFPLGSRYIRVPIEYVEEGRLSTEAFMKLSADYAPLKEVQLLTKEDFSALNTDAPTQQLAGYDWQRSYLQLKPEVEKMSKSKYNVVNPEKVIDKHGVDAFRMYEMFLGPMEQSKPWNTESIDGVSRFLRRFWSLFFNATGEWQVSEADPDDAELKILHKTIKKITEDIERFSLNTCVSTFMVAANELIAKQSYKRAILEPLLVLIAPFAPHIAEELWRQMGHEESIAKVAWPEWNNEYLVENTFEYPVSINGKLRTKLELPLSMPKEEVEHLVLTNDIVLKWAEGKPVKKVVVVPGRIVNVVI